MTDEAPVIETAFCMVISSWDRETEWNDCEGRAMRAITPP
ncbi:hypothetical protein FHS91_002259 [Sphingobium xanthum]